MKLDWGCALRSPFCSLKHLSGWFLLIDICNATNPIQVNITWNK